MFDCSEEISRFHADLVNLPEATRTAMRERRNTNRDRLKSGLKSANKPTPKEFVSQGSYAMRTMVQHQTNDIDIDDGVYFGFRGFKNLAWCRYVSPFGSGDDPGRGG